MSAPIAPTMPPEILAAVSAWETRRGAEQATEPVAPLTSPQSGCVRVNPPATQGRGERSRADRDTLSALRALFEQGAFGTIDQFARTVRRNRRAVRLALNVLIREGVVVPEKEKPKTGRPKTVFRPVRWMETHFHTEAGSH
jgi:hypothetical protein